MLPLHNRRSNLAEDVPGISNDLSDPPGRHLMPHFLSRWRVVFFLVLAIWFILSVFLVVRKDESKATATKFMDERSTNTVASLFESFISNVTQMHGSIGYNKDRIPLWKPLQYSPSKSMAQLLRDGGGFNLELSDSLPLDRNVKDSRDPACRDIIYDISKISKASVIIVFFNEPFSTLFRSVHSVLNRTPPEILEEIILVDDGGDLPWIKADGTGQLENYIKYLPKTRLVRSPARKGIVSARTLGIQAAKAPIFVILDSHIEVNEGWLEPLSSRITEDPRRVLMPHINGIDAETFENSDGGIGCILEHGIDADEKSPLDRRHAKASDYVSSPTMAGGLFAADKSFFMDHLGGYDMKFEFWGTENLELSFRTWMCGGVLECTGCSKVYHIFRKGGSGYSSPADSVTKNKMRLMTIWMDEYADLAWRVIGKPRVDFGEISSLLQFRKKCKSFSWFLNEVYPESAIKEVPRDVPYLGPIKNLGSGLCLDGAGSSPSSTVSLYQCNGYEAQDWMYFKKTQNIMAVLNDESCFGADNRPEYRNWCRKNQARWSYDPETKMLMHEETKKCLTENQQKLEFANCDSKDKYQFANIQKWELTEYKVPAKFPFRFVPAFRGGGYNRA